MALPATGRHPAGMFSTHLVRIDREFILRGSRLPSSLISAAVLGVSLLITVAPVLGAAADGHGQADGNGSSNVKVHDATTGEEGLGHDNEPHVCAFWLEFTMPAPYENGAWTLVSWPPTGDGSTVAGGAYDTSGDGTDASSVIDMAAGHYRVEWAETGATVTKKKTFWVDASCDAAGASIDESAPEAPAGSGDPSPSESSSIDESPAEDPAASADEVGSPDESPTESPVESSADESTTEAVVTPAEESIQEDALTADESPADGSPAESGDQDVLSGSGSGDESPADQPGSPANESPADQPASPVDEPAGGSGDQSSSAGSSDEEQAQSDGPAASNPGIPPAQDELGGHGDSGGSDMADTAALSSPLPTGLGATLGLLILIVVHGSLRRTRRREVA
jgi:hypothetical protein